MTWQSRRDQIVGAVRDAGVASVRDLALRLEVSQSTIRRDLALLERDGAIARTYGGAVVTPRSTGDGTPGTPVTAETRRQVALRDAMAEQAAALVPDGSEVLLDLGSTPPLIARRLRGRPVTVITANLGVFDELRDDGVVELVLLGGAVRHELDALGGQLTQQSLRAVSADLLFLSCTGVRASGHVVDSVAAGAPVKHAMIEASDRVVLLAPETKFPGSGALRVCSLSDVDTLITTGGADPETTRRCQQAGGKVIVA